MAKQVKPFANNICLGYMVWCQDKDFREPEGIVIFDSSPNKGDKCTLCDGKSGQ